MGSTYIETIRRYYKEGFEWIREYGIDKTIYATNRILRRWGIKETVTFLLLSTPKIDFHSNQVYFYAIGVERTGYPLAYISLQQLSLVCYWGYLCTFPLPLPSKGVISVGAISNPLPFPISLPTALAVATFATHFPVRDWIGSAGIYQRESQYLFAALISLPPKGSGGYTIEIIFWKQGAWGSLKKWGEVKCSSELPYYFSGGYNKIVREAVRLAALLTL
jgi:hypothetical protein